MKSYRQLYERGVKYNKMAVTNWYKRRAKLQALFMHSKSVTNVPRMQKILRLIVEIDERTDHIDRFLRQTTAQRVDTLPEVLQTFINLKCPSKICQANRTSGGKAVRLQCYVPGEEKCDVCGCPLVTEEDISINKMLAEMGISFSE